MVSGWCRDAQLLMVVHVSRKEREEQGSARHISACKLMISSRLPLFVAYWFCVLRVLRVLSALCALRVHLQFSIDGRQSRIEEGFGGENGSTH